MNKKKAKSPDELSLDLVINDMNLANAFAAVARSAYRQGRLAEADSARTKTVRFYCEALRLLLQLGEHERKSFSADLEGLRTNIQWLSLQHGLPGRLAASDNSIDRLLKLLEEKG
jgi:hypothetical protein